MCYDVAYMTRHNEKLVQRYGASLPPGQTLPLYHHVRGFDHPELPVIAAEEPGRIHLFRWGLIPHWVRDEQQARRMARQTLNAMAETVFEKPSYRQAIRRHRCLVLVDGFYEWHTRQHPNEKRERKYPHFIRMIAQETFALGGLYSTWTNRSTGEVLHTFSLITVPANNLLARIHNSKQRMPLILLPEQAGPWLDPEQPRQAVEALMKPLPDGLLEAYPVSPLVGSRRQPTNVPEAWQPYVYPELTGMA